MSNDSQVSKEITLGGIVYIVKGTVDISIVPKTVTPPVPPVVDPTKPPVVPPVATKPDSFGTIKDGEKWTKNPGPAATWILKNMDNPKEKFKFISATDGLNIIADIDSEAQAKALQEYFKTQVFPPKENGGTIPDEPVIEPGTGVKPEPSPVGAGEGPYKSSGNRVETTQRGPTTRNYASGKPSDWTIEKNAKGIKFPNVQAFFDIDVPAVWEHDDNLNIKIGGTHMGTGWFSNTLSIYEGKSGLGKEEEHPSTQSNVVKGKSYGDIRGKRVQIASTYFKAENKTELWVKIGEATTWDLACGAKDVGGFNPKATGETEVQLRIDGFKEKEQPPKINVAIVQDISG